MEAVEQSALPVAYFREKALQFQGALNEVDAVAQAARSAAAAEVDSRLTTDLAALLSEFDQRRITFRLTAEGVNAGAALYNSLGGALPALKLPAGLGMPPLALPVAAVAAIGIAANLVLWSHGWIARVTDRMREAMNDPALAPEARQSLQDALTRADTARESAIASPVASIAPLVKWGAIAIAAWIAYRAFSRSQGGDGIGDRSRKERISSRGE